MAERIDKGGLAAALAIVGASGGIVGEDGAQAEMFEADEAPLPLPTKGKSGPKGGRPRGARNRSTEEWVAWFLTQHRSPLTTLANIAGQDLRELHALLQDLADSRTRTRTRSDGQWEEVRVLVDPLAVLKVQRDAAAALLPYIHKQQPKALEIAERARGVVILGELNDLEPVADGGSDDLAVLPAEGVKNQWDSKAAPTQSDADAVGNAEKSPNNNKILLCDD